MKKLKDLLNESAEMGRVYSNPFATAFVKETEKTNTGKMEMTEEQKQAFYEAVKQYKRYGESVYRNEGLSEVYESIKNMVEVARKVTLSETGDWFDNVTVGRHMKRMGESFRVFEKTLKEVSTLQQRLEASYDEIGEVLGKYYEINEMEDEIEEGNEFGAARAKAIAAGNDSFEVDGKTYPVKDVDKDDKENAKEFSNESMKLTDMIKGKLVNESPSSEEIRIAMLAVNKQKKYRQVPPSRAVTDVQNALDVIDRDIKKGKIKDESVNEAKFKVLASFGGYDLIEAPTEKDMIISKNGKKVGKLTKISKYLKDDIKSFINMVKSGKLGESVNENDSYSITDDKGRPFLLIVGEEPKDSKGKSEYKKDGFYISPQKGFKGLITVYFKDEKTLKKNIDKKYHNQLGESVNEGKFKVDDLVYNKRTKTVGIVRMGDDKYGEVKTDADGNVNVDELEKYNPIKNKHQNNAKVAPSTEKEVSKRGLFNPFKNESVMNEAKYDIGMARKGNGLTIYNKAEEEKGDYKNIAHIDNKGNIKLYDKKLPTNIKKMIEKEAEKLKESVNEEAITYGIEYKSSKNDRKFKKASLTKTTHNHNIDNMMIKAISKDAKSLAKQDGCVDYRITKDGVPVNESINEGTKMIKLKNLLNESKVSDAWKKNNKRGKILKVGNVTLKSDGPGGIHSISKNGKKWGTFELDGNDWMVKPTYGKENWVDSIDNVIKIVNESKSMKLTDMLNESIGIGELPSSKLMKMKVPAKDMLKSVNEAKFKKVTKQMWAKMDYDEIVNALLTFFKDPDDAEEYGDSEWNNLPSGADGGMYIFE